MTALLKQTTPTLADIDTLAQTYAESHAELVALLAKIDEETRTVYERHAATLMQAATLASGHKDELVAAVDGARDLFAKPKSQTLAGVKVGLRKGIDKLTYDDDTKLIDRIVALFPDQARTLLRQKTEVNKDALKTLPSKDRQRLGVKLVSGADEPFATIAKSDAEKAAAVILEKVADAQ
ncbi:MAG: host-nuclease inhibitor Gam family protein [Pseudomonadota bacterium]